MLVVNTNLNAVAKNAGQQGQRPWSPVSVEVKQIIKQIIYLQLGVGDEDIFWSLDPDGLYEIPSD